MYQTKMNLFNQNAEFEQNYSLEAILNKWYGTTLCSEAKKKKEWIQKQIAVDEKHKNRKRLGLKTVINSDYYSGIYNTNCVDQEAQTLLKEFRKKYGNSFIYVHPLLRAKLLDPKIVLGKSTISEFLRCFLKINKIVYKEGFRERVKYVLCAKRFKIYKKEILDRTPALNPLRAEDKKQIQEILSKYLGGEYGH